MSTQNVAGRQVWPDAARGIGIVLVVWGHIVWGLVLSGSPVPRFIAEPLMFSIYTFHMPIFFFLSGLWISHGMKAGPKQFLISKGKTVLYPYIIWAVFQGLVNLLMSRFVNSPMSWTDILLIPVQPSFQFWFLYALMLMAVIVAAFWPHRVALGVFAIVLCIIALLIEDIRDAGVWGKIALYFVYYIAGSMFADLRRGVAVTALENISIKRATALSICSWMGLALACWMAWTLTDDYQSLVALPATLLGVCSVILTGAALRKSKILIWLGQISLSIFVMHVLAGAGIRILLKKAGAPDEFWFQVGMGMIAGVGLPAMAHEALRRLDLLSYLGLTRLPRRQKAEISAAKPG